MAFSSIIRRNGASLAIRALRTQRSGYHPCYALVLTSVKSVRAVTSDRVFGDLFLGRDHGVSCHFDKCYSTKSSSSEDALLKVIESEIRCAEESDDHDKVEEVPGGFPFEIEDKPGYQTVTLSREYQGEEIKVEVSMPDLVTGEEDEGGNENDDDEKGNQSSIPLVVSVAKGNNPCLEFGCTAYPDEVVIESLAVRKPENGEGQIAYEGPDFQDLDENLQKAFHKYLEIRGIKPSTTNFLYEYMINKDSREYLNWLKNLKKFVVA